MSGKRIVEETLCPCGKPPSGFLHKTPECPPECASAEYGHDDDWHDFCTGGSRRTLTEGQYVLIEKVDGSWPEWAWSRLQDYRLGGTETTDLLDALSDHTEGTP